jgi:hypothetical protein
MPLSVSGIELVSMVKKEFCGSKRTRKILSPDFLFDFQAKESLLAQKKKDQKSKLQTPWVKVTLNIFT